MSADAITAPALRRHLTLFAGTVASAFITRAYWTPGTWTTRAYDGAQFAATLLTILLAHELGHYIAARLHKVPASLPFFIPLPIISPFGTMGAVIRMRGTIPTRRALLDIGAAGPLAGLVFAIPLYVWGVSHSTVIPISDAGMSLGDSLLLRILDRAAPAHGVDSDILLSPIAYGAWGGMFVTMINLFPVGQLDGGHVAYALFGKRQDTIGLYVHRAMLVFFFVVVGGHVAQDLSHGLGLAYLGKRLGNGMAWIVWYQLVAILGTLSGRSQEGYVEKPGELTIRTRLVATLGLLIVGSFARDEHTLLLPICFFAGLAVFLAMEWRGGLLKKHTMLDHPPTTVDKLDAARAGVAILTLVIFVMLFMPEPMSM